MKVTRIKSRNTVYSYDVQNEWNLNLHVIRGVVHDFIIDSGLGSKSIEPVLNELKARDKPIILVNTHYHWDHVWGNCAFEKGTIIAHQLCRDILDERWESDQEKLAQYAEGNNSRALPNLVFEKELYFPEDQVRLIHTPGHTEDSITVIDEVDGVINAGDNIGDTMDEIVPSLACENTVFIETLLKLREIDFQVCVSGHNKILDKSVLDVILARL